MFLNAVDLGACRDPDDEGARKRVRRKGRVTGGRAVRSG
jgi:hypothetical protein